MTYALCKKLIKSGNFVKADMTSKLDVFLLNDRISDQEYNQMVVIMDIKSGEYVKEVVMAKLDVYLSENKITQEQYNELVAMINAI